MCIDTHHNDTKEVISAQETSAMKLRLLASRGGSEEGLKTEIIE
jgi:hypothetical protein